MKKILFWVLSILAFIVAVRIGHILIFDFSRLTEYGFGYLSGLIVLFLLLLSIIIFWGLKLFRKKAL